MKYIMLERPRLSTVRKDDPEESWEMEDEQRTLSLVEQPRLQQLIVRGSSEQTSP